MKYNKNGVSAVIATVLIILITVAAVAIIWALILPMINDSTKGATACLGSQAQLEVLDSSYTYVGANNVSFQVRRGSGDFDLKDIQITLDSGDGNSKSLMLIANETAPHPTLKPSPISEANLPGVNEEKVYVINFTGTPKSIKVAPVVAVGDTGKIKVCDSSNVVLLS